LPQPPVSILFVVDGKRLEAMSLILAASLAQHHDTENGVRLLAYVKATEQPNMDPATLALYEACGVQIARLPLAEEGLWAKPYPHGNKILAAAQPRDSQRSIFLDTDMVCVGPITDVAESRPHEVFVVPEGAPTWGKEGDRWARAYDFIGQPVPEARVTLTRGRKISYPPYFNGGFVGFSDQPITAEGKTFGQLWLDFASHFDRICPIGGKRPWLDQITLPLAMAQHGIGYQVLPETYNFSVSERKRLGKVAHARMVHYHRTMYFKALPLAEAYLQAVRDKVPARHHAALDVLLEQFSGPPTAAAFLSEGID
jgi:hypothetical protein